MKCPDCGKVMDARGANSHARNVHGKPNATKADFETMSSNNQKPVFEADSEQEAMQLMQETETGELVDVTDNAIVFRNEIIVTDPEIKERIADKLVNQLSNGAQF